MHPDTESSAATLYGTPEHAVREALTQSVYNSDGWITCDIANIAQLVVAGLRERGFAVDNRPPLCDCGWTGHGTNHLHDARMGRASTNPVGSVPEGNDPASETEGAQNRH